MKPFQIAQISKIRLHVSSVKGLLYWEENDLKGERETLTRFKIDYLLALKSIHVLIFRRGWELLDTEKCRASVKRQLGVLLAGRDVDIVYIETDLTDIDIMELQVTCHQLNLLYTLTKS